MVALQNQELPMTNASTCWPSLLYQGGRPAVYIVRLLVRMMGARSVLIEAEVEHVLFRFVPESVNYDSLVESCVQSHNFMISE